MTDCSERLFELRNEKGISQKEAALSLHVSQALLSHYEKGIRECGLDFLCRAADYYGVSADFILGRTESRYAPDTNTLEDQKEDAVFNAATIYRAAVMTHERMNAGSALAGEKADLLYSVTLYRTLFTAAANGYIPKRWFTLPPKYAQSLPLALTESLLDDFPEKTSTAKRYGGPEPLCIETVIKNLENTIRKLSATIKPGTDQPLINSR